MIFNIVNFGFFRRNRKEPDRPVERPVLGPVDWLLEAIALSGLMFILGYTMYNFPHLPETIPTHFTGSGHANEYGGKDSFLILPGVALFIYVLMTLINLVPHKFNFTVKITPANALRQYAMATRMVRTLKVILIWVFWYISYSTIQVAKGTIPGLGLWFVPVLLGLTFVPIVIYFIMAAKKS